MLPKSVAGVVATALLGATCVLADAARAESARVIVQFKPDARVLAKAGADVRTTLQARSDDLAKRHGVVLTPGPAVHARAQVVRAEGVTSEALARRLAADPDVEYAEPDRRRRTSAAPNDPLYPNRLPGNGPATGQWYLRAPATGVAASIDAERAWSVTTGAPGIVVAVLDTGVRFEHPDLQPVSAGGNLLPGFDMIADATVANDGDGRDPDASDPGDWVTKEEVDAATDFKDCEVRNSSWHGTLVSGLIGALTDNGVGMASVARTVRVLPVRVLGKCGGYDSDIIAGMRWAAGLDVPGVAPNPSPAHVLNLSFGGEGTCGAAYRSTVDELVTRGRAIVAAAGNSAGHAVMAPGNCPGVMAVAAVRHVGTKVGFSDLGPEVAISAPGGNCVNVGTGTACLYPILSTSNDGTTVPGTSVYTDGFRVSVGTSFAAPLVSGTAALMLAVRPSLTPPLLRAFLQATARPFPVSTDPNVPRCTAPQLGADGTPVDQLECTCTTSTCGAGMLDAGRAVVAAQAGVQAVTVVEFHHAGLDHYFMTASAEEAAFVDAGGAGAGWQRTGYGFVAESIATQTDVLPLCRFYGSMSPGPNSHFYTLDRNECEGLIALQATTPASQPRWNYEGTAFAAGVARGGICVHPAFPVPVYRLYNDGFAHGKDSNHRYTARDTVVAQMVARGWRPEGVVYCVKQAQ